ncbi:hypothetical protein A2641_01515 [Candidatus Nomurabacteria bacterium RIFCSPHIGHO2_01_FULL_37_25]|uniref:Uncharacterized protein n=1 Tax=Candidatus Nomurabacteria bacterium RIFCSPLOWO2_01_FULL_36_16 TaxID=1801767 RepID=A0A1F6WZ07_9BACT|nr:MAG: hypothetical protein A2641_01515 [Candidatus Nomurabacteria bacterium RIFCSPHIGHO2_01_FULL_37_25]OGI75389.1 MAG: hypothetical protein A3D36_02415 [Candidatus Nomurabacteria bacterium RIFCSPHIGHO2_02_FULL_36_29]OGI87136.1 MAG: hypothetical protein A3A91_00510 [Candidatus Nomurabacteria bacterium RIFCSPLOWO2_01_FULL_36_16]OGI97302.1 MAG: hypothetical protein A3I84_00845 [Candidatus Nomurabacteria bacterium RIFCSPLOWO2_02_FULL_36_8]
MSKTYEALKRVEREQEIEKTLRDIGKRDAEIEESDNKTREDLRRALVALAEAEGKVSTEPEATFALTSAPAPVKTAAAEAPEEETATPVKSLKEKRNIFLEEMEEDEGWKMADEEADPEKVGGIAEIERRLRKEIAEDEKDKILEERLKEALKKKMQIKKNVEKLRKR